MGHGTTTMPENGGEIGDVTLFAATPSTAAPPAAPAAHDTARWVPLPGSPPGGRVSPGQHL